MGRLLSATRVFLPSLVHTPHCFLLTVSIFAGPTLIAHAAPPDYMSSGFQAPVPSTVQSDPAAIQAMQNVLAQSGGATVWQGLRSAEETFTVSKSPEEKSQVQLFLDDWSLETTRYRRALKGQSTPSADHNGVSSFTVNVGNIQETLPEFDQARTLVRRLPAASAEIMLRRGEYVLKIDKSERCAASDVCVSVFRKLGNQSYLPEQRWTITAATGLPSRIRVTEIQIKPVQKTIWEEVHFLNYANQNGVIVPSATRVTKVGGSEQTWTLVSFQGNTGFNTTAFDQEAVQ
jgi:hypothetical protein